MGPKRVSRQPWIPRRYFRMFSISSGVRGRREISQATGLLVLGLLFFRLFVVRLGLGGGLLVFPRLLVRRGALLDRQRLRDVVGEVLAVEVGVLALRVHLLRELALFLRALQVLLGG